MRFQRKNWISNASVYRQRLPGSPRLSSLFECLVLTRQLMPLHLPSRSEYGIGQRLEDGGLRGRLQKTATVVPAQVMFDTVSLRVALCTHYLYTHGRKMYTWVPFLQMSCWRAKCIPVVAAVSHCRESRQRTTAPNSALRSLRWWVQIYQWRQGNSEAKRVLRSGVAQVCSPTRRLRC